ncbi:uncharacterized protein LOC113502934 isoform X2 [Trichoplusia ni]|uniref:Uncharacterized protein LOC113502934 isoform X2 n=1 Tax=Trichoplusia ni TaxID=7111 RepID=A0A7E5WK33_TRINI|nr:uncharacterized protein LOC113502934 isoform X2 [Trichoplusia ni]
MSKRYFPQQQGERKKAKLNISVSDHNFPLSQNSEFNKVTNNDDKWGDDNDDEILMLASQACEEACSSNDISLLPNYSMFMQPGSTSTQMGATSSQITFQPSPSTSKSEFTFKRPSFNSPSAISTHLKEKCNRISSPLPGISSKVIPKANGQVNLSDELIFNDKVCKGQDIDQMYRKLLQMQEECEKLKSVNGKLLEKCITKEGEASILRTQLKTCQTSVDNARLEKIKALEKVQVECTEKLTAANKQMHDLRTQLDFKNLEIISIKEKCKKLETTKVKLTQVMVTGNDISQSHRVNLTQNESITNQSKRAKTLSTSVQTENQAPLLQLHKTCEPGSDKHPSILPFILEPSVGQNHSILDYNDKLQKTADYSQNKCRIYSTFHRVPSSPVPKETGKTKVLMSSVYEDITSIFVGNCEGIEQKYFNIFNTIRRVLNETRSRLETVCQRVTTSFQKEMDEKYMEVTSNYQVVTKEDLLRGRALFKEEQEIMCRRMVAMLSYVLDSSSGTHWFSKHEQLPDADSEVMEGPGQFIETIHRICVLIDNASCATLYSGLLLSIITVISTIASKETNSKVLEIIKTILTSRPMPFVVTSILDLVKNVSGYENFLTAFCPGNGTGNLKTDYDQGVLLYKKDSCFIQVLLKQTEVCLKCIEKQNLRDKALETTQSLINLHTNINDDSVGSLSREKTRCDCQLVLVQVIVYALRICAVMLDGCKSNESCALSQQLLRVCRCGGQLLQRRALRDAEPSALAHAEGHLVDYCERLRAREHPDACTIMLAELAGTLQSSSEDMPPLFHRQPWLKSFEDFSLTD